MRLPGALLLVAAAAAAARAEGVAWSSAAYVRAVLETSPEVATARENLTGAEASLKSETARTFFPTLGLSASLNPAELAASNRFTFDAWRLSANDVALTPSLSWNLFNGFKDVTALKRTRIDRERSRLDLEVALQARALTAIRNYYGLILRENLLEVEKKNREAQREQYRLTQDRYKHGMKSLSDLLKTETDLRSAELDVESAEAERRLSLFRFNVLINRDEGGGAAFPADLQLGTTVLPSLAAGLRTALADRPEMRKNRLTLERADLTRRLARLNALPSLSAAFSYSDSLSAPYGARRTPLGAATATYGFTFTLSLPSSFNFYSQRQDLVAAAAAWRVSRNAAEELRRSIRQEVYQAHIGLQRSLRSYEIAARAEDIAKQNLDLVREQYSQGSADVIRLSQALLDYVRAQSRRMQAFQDANTNLAAYRVAIGEPIWH